MKAKKLFKTALAISAMAILTSCSQTENRAVGKSEKVGL